LDLLGSFSRDQLHIYSWGVAAGFLLVVGIFRWRSLHWTALGSVLLFAALNAGAGIYVLNHFGDSRWSAGGEPPLSAPSFSGMPFVGETLAPLESAMQSVMGVVNEFLAFKQALPVAVEFLAASGWALLVSFPVAVIAAIISILQARRRRADFKKYRATVDLLKAELEQVKQQISAPTFVGSALPARDAFTDELPRMSRRG
jgi:hypothetical protein